MYWPALEDKLYIKIQGNVKVYVSFSMTVYNWTVKALLKFKVVLIGKGWPHGLLKLNTSISTQYH